MLVDNQEIILEQEIIACIFKDNDLFLKAKDTIKDYMLSIETHRSIYKAVEEMIGEGLDVDMVSFIQRFKTQIVEFGGVSYITEISNCTASTVGFKTKLELLTQNYNKRIMLKLKEKLEENKSIDELTYIVEDTLTEIYNSKLSKEINIDTQYENYLEEIFSENKERGIKSGLDRIDEVLGNFQPGRMITLFARAGIGKTTVALQMALNMALKKKKVIYGSGEMSNFEVFNKMCASELNIPYSKFSKRQLIEEEKNNVAALVSELNASKLYVTNETDIDKLINEVKLYKLRNGLEVLFIDYVNKYISNTKGSTLTEKIGQVTAKLKDLALKEEICVVLLAQANRKSDEKIGDIEDKITEADIQDSARIEQDSDQIIALYRNKKLDNKDVRKELHEEGKLNYSSTNAEKNPWCINAIVVKNRHGERATLAFKWDPQFSRVKNFVR